MASSHKTTAITEEVEELRRQVCASLARHGETALGQLLNVWSEMGLSPEQMFGRLTTAADAICEHITNLVKSDEELKISIEQNIADNLKRVAGLCTELRKPHMPLDLDGFTLVDSEKAVIRHLGELRAEKEQRLIGLKAQLAEEAAFCSILDMPRLGLDPQRVPSDQEMAEIRDQVIFLRNLKEKRINRFKELRAGIIGSLEALGRGPDTTLAVDVVSENEETCSLAKARMDAMEKYHSQVRAELDQRKQEVGKLRSTMEALWDRLDIEDDERELFHVPDEFTDHVVDLLKREIERLNELKMENIERFVNKCRAEIQTKWDACFLTQEQRDEFTPFQSEAFSEELLLIHEREAQRLSDYIQQNKELLQLITKWETMWTRREEIIDAQHDPNRYNNRGCNLLQEEKEIKKIKLQIPKVENKICELSNEYQERTGEVFLFRGLPFQDYVKIAYDKIEAERLANREARHRAKENEIRKEAIYGTNTKKCTDRTPLKQKKLEMTHSTAKFKTPSAPLHTRPSTKKTADRPTLTRDRATLKRPAGAGPSGESTSKAVRRNILGEHNARVPAASTANYLPRAAPQCPTLELSRASEAGDYDTFARKLHQNPGLASSYLHVPK